jgi:hypothetical protein
MDAALERLEKVAAVLRVDDDSLEALLRQHDKALICALRSEIPAGTALECLEKVAKLHVNDNSLDAFEVHADALIHGPIPIPDGDDEDL